MIANVAGAAEHPTPAAAARLRGRVTDALGRPLSGVGLELRTGGGLTIAHTTSDARGRFTFKHLGQGLYSVIARKQRFATATASVKDGGARPLTIAMASEQPLSLEIILNKARNALSPETGSTMFRFTNKNIDQLPQGDNTPLNDVLIQAPGVSQDSYGQGQGQIHVHGLNGGGIQYRLNAVFLPEPVSSFGQLLSPYFIKSMNVVENFMPAQFGYRNEAVIDIQTKDGCLEPGGKLEYYGGQRGTIQPSVQYGGCSGKLSYFLSGFYLRSALGVQSPTKTPTPTHDRTDQGQGLGYFSYLFTPTTRLSLIAGTANNFFRIPGQPNLPIAFPLAGLATPPNSADLTATEFEQNQFGILALESAPTAKLNYQLAYISRYYRLTYDPDPVGDLIYNGIADQVLHSGFINAVQEDTSYRLNPHHRLQGGFYLSGETLGQDNRALVFPIDPATGRPRTRPEAVVDNFNGEALVFGAYAQDQWNPAEKLELSLGARFDLVDYSTWQYQVSPRFGVVYQLTPRTTLNAGYARYFQLPPFEAVLLENVRKFEGTTGGLSITSGNQNIKAEDDEFFDAGVSRRLPFGLNATFEGFFMWATNKLDLAQVGSTYIFAPLQYTHGRLWGADLSLVKTTSRLSAYFNFSYSVVEAKNIAAGQFLLDDPAELKYVATHWVHLDDNQEFTSSAGVSCRLWGFLVTIDGIWGSGYRFGFANLKTQLPYVQVNAAVAHKIPVPELGELQGRLSIVNLFDHVYLIRQGSGIGVFAPQYGPRRALVFTLTLPLGAARSAGPHVSH